MKDIEKRACDMKVAIKGGYVPESALKKYFLKELEKQRKIDIEKACEAYCKTCDTKECEDFGCEYCCDWVEKFRKSMEE